MTILEVSISLEEEEEHRISILLSNLGRQIKGITTHTRILTFRIDLRTTLSLIIRPQERFKAGEMKSRLDSALHPNLCSRKMEMASRVLLGSKELMEQVTPLTGLPTFLTMGEVTLVSKLNQLLTIKLSLLLKTCSLKMN